MSDDVRLRFEADDNLSQAVNKINGRLGEMDNTTKKNQKSTGGLTSAVKKATLAFGAYVSVTRAWSMAQRSIAAYDKQIKAEAELERALGYTSQALLDQATALQAVTRFGDEATIEAMGLVAAFVDEEKQIKQLMPLIQDLATAKSMDLNAAADLVTKTLASSTNAMSRYGIEVEGAQGSTERLESLTNSLEKAFGGAAVTAGQTGAGQIEIYRNRLGDLQEDIGEKLLPAMTAFYKVTVNIAEFIADNMSVILVGLTGSFVALTPAIFASAGALKAKTLAATGLTVAQQKLNIAMKAAPYIAVGMAVAYAARELRRFIDNTNEAKRANEDLETTNKMLAEQQKNVQRIQAIRNELKQEGNRLSKEEIQNLEEELSRRKKIAQAQRDQIQGFQGLKEERIEAPDLVVPELESDVVDIVDGSLEALQKAREASHRQSELALMESQERQIAIINDDIDKRLELYKGEEDAHIEQIELLNDEREKRVQEVNNKIMEIERRRLSEQEAAEFRVLQEIERYQMNARDRAIAELEDEIEVKKSILGEDAENLILLEEYKQQRIDEIKEQYAEKEEERTNNALQYSQFAYDQISSIMSAVSSNRMKELDAEYKKEKEIIDSSRMSRRAKEQATQKLEEETAKKRHEIALKQWRQDLIMSIANTALGVARTLANVGLPAGIPLMAMAGVAGAVSTGIIASNKPKFADGGFVPGQSTSGDRVGVQVNSGEAILNANQQREFMAIANGRRGTEQPGNQIGDTTINISGNATPDTVNQLENTLANHRQAMLEQLYEASSRGEIDTTRLQLA